VSSKKVNRKKVQKINERDVESVCVFQVVERVEGLKIEQICVRLHCCDKYLRESFQEERFILAPGLIGFGLQSAAPLLWV
jgi:hypothetical protein